jgi:Uma2 family endonuclease
MAVVNRISEQEYRELALSDTDHLWELWDGVPREKPSMSMRHDNVSFRLGHFLQIQLDWDEYRVNVNGGKTRLSPRSYYIPDVVVIPSTYQLPFEEDPGSFNAFAEPLPLVVEVWSPSTGHDDVATKLKGYRERGDAEIWFIHPYEGTLTVWRKQSDGSYAEERFRGGVIHISSLPSVDIDLDVSLGVS